MDTSLQPGELSPPLTEPNAQLLYYMMVGRTQPMTLIAGDHWLRYDDNSWTVDADEPATEAEVEAILTKVGGVTTWYGA